MGNLPPEAEEQDVRNRLGQLPVQVDGVEFGKDLQEARSSRGQHAKVVLTTEDGARTARQRCNNEQIRCRKAKEVRSSPPVPVHRSRLLLVVAWLYWSPRSIARSPVSSFPSAVCPAPAGSFLDLSSTRAGAPNDRAAVGQRAIAGDKIPA